MEPLIIKGSKYTPDVILDKNLEKFIIKGRSLPEDVSFFYNPILNWLRGYINDPNTSTTITFELEYFNSSSSKVFIEIILMFKEIISKGLEAKINWCYEEDDDDILEAGQIYESISKIPFIYTAID